MSGSRMVGAATSLALHGALVAAVLLIAHGSLSPPVLFVDLAELKLTPAENSVRPRQASPPRRAPATVRTPQPPASNPPVQAAPLPPPNAASAPTPQAEKPATPAIASAPPRAESSIAVESLPPPVLEAPPAALETAVAPMPNVGERASTPRLERPPGDAAAASVAATAAVANVPGAEYGTYLAGLRSRIQTVLRYPPAARRRGLAGVVQVEFEILPTGAIGPVVVARPSKHRLLDDAAVETIRNLPPLPFPPDLPARPLRVRIPLVFELE